MTKIELLSLNEVISSLKLPKIPTERRLAWLQLSSIIRSKAQTILNERIAISDAADIDDEERSRMWKLLLTQNTNLSIEPIGQAELLAIFEVNDNLTLHQQQFMLDELSEITQNQ